jgi:urease beta subunit
LQLKTMTSKAGLDQSKHYASGATALAAEPGHQRRPRLIKLDQVRRCYGGTARR